MLGQLGLGATYRSLAAWDWEVRGVPPLLRLPTRPHHNQAPSKRQKRNIQHRHTELHKPGSGRTVRSFSSPLQLPALIVTPSEYVFNRLAENMQRLRFALTSLIPAACSPLSASPVFMGCKSVANVLKSRPGTFHLRNNFSTFANSTLPSLSEAKDVLNSQGSIRVRKALEVDGRSKMDAKEFVELCSRNGLDELQAMDLSAALHKAAFIFHFQSSPSEVLRSTVFLKPLEVVSKVHEAFDLSGSVAVAHLASLQAEQVELRAKIKAHDDVKHVLDHKAEAAANRRIWAGLSFPASLFAVLARFTYWEFSWDIVEPISFFTTAIGPMTGFYLYFAITKREFSLGSWRERLIEEKKRRLYDKHDFPIAEYNALCQKNTDLEAAIVKAKSQIAYIA